ncbi:MAG: MBL fold metallo-hydrolase [Clostridia bacterium]|nr:MBL fold metallo-hydrolase [Clostridia bacterium]
MKKNNARGSLIGSIIVIVMLLIAAVFGSDDGSFFTSQASNDPTIEQVEGLENITIYTGSDCISQIPNDNSLRLYCLDVGQGDSILIVNQGKTMLIDASINEMGSTVVKYLKDLGITKIDYLVGTHPHEDHIGGFDNVIREFDIGTIYMPKKASNTKTFEEVLDAIKAKNLKVTAPTIGTKFSIGDANCEVMAIQNDAEDTNETSIVIQMECNNTKYLFTGDANYNVENSRAWEEVDVLKVGHHGSRTSTTKKFLDQVKPKIALISVGKDNSYGHPTEDTLKRLNNIGSKIYRTDENGTILIVEKK